MSADIYSGFFFLCVSCASLHSVGFPSYHDAVALTRSYLQPLPQTSPGALAEPPRRLALGAGELLRENARCALPLPREHIGSPAPVGALGSVFTPSPAFANDFF